MFLNTALRSYRFEDTWNWVIYTKKANLQIDILGLLLQQACLKRSFVPPVLVAYNKQMMQTFCSESGCNWTILLLNVLGWRVVKQVTTLLLFFLAKTFQANFCLLKNELRVLQTVFYKKTLQNTPQICFFQTTFKCTEKNQNVFS